MLLKSKKTSKGHKKNSAISDSYNEIASRLINRLKNSQNHIIAFTSSISGEGCTKTVLGVSSALARVGKKVLIIDANYRDPSLPAKLRMESLEGFSDLLISGGEIKNHIRKHSSCIDIMSFGTKAKEYLRNFNAENFEVCINGICEDYDYIVIDTPPISKISEPSAAIYTHANTLLVARMNLVTTKNVEKSVSFAKEFGFEFMSVVLNGTEQ